MRTSEKSKAKIWTVYIIQTECGKLYTGITLDLERRFQEHQKKQKGARFFSLAIPKQIVFVEKYCGRSEASKREYAIKKMSRQDKLALIETHRQATDL